MLADRRLPESGWPRTGPVDLVLFEGWFLGTPAEPEAALAEPLNALERDEDPDGRWRRWCNDALARDYPPLWQRIDRLLFLQGPRSEEHTSELQSLMRISYAVFCLNRQIYTPLINDT